MWSAKYLMDSNSTLLAVPNPNTPLVFLPPTLATQFEILCYVTFAGLTVNKQIHTLMRLKSHFFSLSQAFICEWIMSLADEYKICRRTRLRVPDIVYLISRLVSTLVVPPIPHKRFSVATLGYCVSATIFQGDCDNLPV